jgi:signal transduction histidine kinase
MEQLKHEDSNSFETTGSRAASDGICRLMQQLGLPALRITPETMEVAGFNGLFADLLASRGIRDYRLWFVEGVLPLIKKGEKADWLAKAARSESSNASVRFTLRDGRKRDFEMQTMGMTKQEAAGPSIICAFISSSGKDSQTRDELAFAQGQAMERSRIRRELHKNVSQKLLGAAFGCKLLAGKIKGLNEDFAQQASDLADLLNTTVMDLQDLTRRGSDYD